jgi:ABC-type uncharacterized transport system involved in gliding motility auxiliary subunit
MKIVKILQNVGKNLLTSLGIGISKASRSRQARFGSNSLVSLLAVVGILILANLIVKNQGWRWDSTKNKVNSLSNETIKVIKSLKKPVKFVVFARPEYQTEPKKLLQEYSSRNSKITSEFINPYSNPTVAQKYGITRADTTLVLEGENKQELHSNTETDFTSALIKLSNPNKVKVTFWTGNGEKSPELTDDTGFSTVKEALLNLNYEVDKQDSILSSEVASGTGVLVIAGPQKSYTDKQKESITKYLDNGGRLLVMLDPILGNVQRTGIEDILSKYALKITNGVVVDPAQKVNEQPNFPAVAEYEKHQITDLLQVTFYPNVMSVESADKVPDNFVVEPLVKTSALSWLETNLASTTQVERNPSDPPGPVSIAVAVHYTASDKNDKKNKMRIVAIGDSDAGTNLITKPEQGKTIYAPGNLDFIVNSINWLAAQENLINITPKDRTNPPITLTSQDSQMIFYLVIVVLPVIFLVLGLLVWRMRRRNKK